MGRWKGGLRRRGCTHIAQKLTQHCKAMIVQLKKKFKKTKEAACNAGDLGSIPGSGRALQSEMTTDSSILAWRIPSTEEAGGLQFMGSQSWT